MTTYLRKRLSRIFLFTIVPVATSPTWGQPASAGESNFGIGLELGPLWISKNDVRVPGDTGNKFDMTHLTGSGPDTFARLDGHWNFKERHGLRLVLAPLEVSGTGELAQDTNFAGETFSAGTTEGTYNFSAYKLTYRYSLPDRGAWRWRIGFTAIIRDAYIELSQGNIRAKDDNVGFVPALHLSGNYRFAGRWLFEIDFDGLAGGPGRIFDAAVKLNYDIDDNWRIGGGYRTLEGGVDSDDVYNFAWLNYAVLDLRYRF